MEISFKSTGAALVLSLVTVSAWSATTVQNYGVGTSAVTGQYFDNYGGVESNGAAYRMVKDSSGNYTSMGNVPPVNFSNCVNASSCLAVQGGTIAPGFGETFSTNHASLMYDAGSGPWFSAASTYANLATGKLGASGSTNYYQTAATVAKFVDTLHFNVSGANASTTTNITVKFQLDGGLSTPSGGNAPGLGIPTASVNDAFSFGNASGAVNFAQVGASPRYGSAETLTEQHHQTGWVSYSWDTVAPGLTQFTGVYALSGISQSLEIANGLSAFASTGGSFAYGNTSSLGLILPSNVTYTSASGTFLSAASPVPEPATWMTMLAGSAMLCVFMQRKSRQRRC